MGNHIPDFFNSDEGDATFIDENDILLTFDDEDDDDSLIDSVDEDRTVLQLLSTASRAPTLHLDLEASDSPHGRSFALLSPEHQRWYAMQGVPEPQPRRALFEPRSTPLKNHPRVRATSLPSSVSSSVIDPPLQSEPECEPEPSMPAHASDALGGTTTTRLEEALARNLALAQQVHRLSRDYEKLSVQLLHAHHRAEDHCRAVEREMEATRKLSRKLELFTERYRVTNEGYAKLKQQLNRLRVDLHAISTENDKLSGDGNYHTMSVPELEALESTLERSVKKVRLALRQQYQDAVDGQREACIVCLHEKVSIVLLPCRHRVLCATCAVRVQCCPVDRVEITDMFPTFGV